jgi:hypothetical protein
MAVATATALAIGSIAVSAGSAGMSFGQARKQRKLGDEAKRDARNAMAQARKALEVNYYDQLAIQKEPYELEREALLSQGALATQAGVEGDRGAAATAGRVQMAMNEAQAGQRTAMGKEMTDLERLSAEEDARNRDIGIQLNLEDVAGAQQAAADAAVARSQAISAGVQQAGAALQGAIEAAPLYTQKIDAQRVATQKALADKSLSGLASQQYNGQTIGSLNFNDMSNRKYRNFKDALSDQQKIDLFQSQPYLQNYNPNPFQVIPQ